MNIKHLDIRNVLLSKIKSEASKQLESKIDKEIDTHYNEISESGALKFYHNNESRLLNLLHAR